MLLILILKYYFSGNVMFANIGQSFILSVIAPPPAEASEIVQQGALDYSEFSQGVG